MPLAPERFVEWLTNNQHFDKTLGHVYRYHSRSDSHSKAISSFVLNDIFQICSTLRQQARDGKVVYKINFPYSWPNSTKKKTIDLALGTKYDINSPTVVGETIQEGLISRVLISMEAKSTMTEHKKSQPRMFDELSSSHGIVHDGDNESIAAGIAVINIADRFVSPLRQKLPNESLVWTSHNQPHVAESMVRHLRGLPIRASLSEKGFDAFATIVINCDNQNEATLWTGPPAPQPGERDHYTTFLQSIAKAYAARFAAI